MILFPVAAHKEIIIKYVTVKKENLILKRNLRNIKIRIQPEEKMQFVLFRKLCNKIKNNLTIIKPETLLKWQRMIIKKNWSFLSENKKPGRPPVPTWIKNLILEIKNTNIYWGLKKIRGELLKSEISLDKKTIRKIIADFRKQGKVKTGMKWRNFIRTNLESLFGMDFFTVDTIFNIRYYVYFIICYETREIIQFAVTTNPKREFVRQQIIEFERNIIGQSKEKVYLIRDNANEFYFDYSD